MPVTDNFSLIAPTPPSSSYADDLLRISLDIGEGMLRSGAEIHRVELTIEKICKAYGASHIEVFSIHSLIIASVRLKNGSYSSQTRRILSVTNHLHRLEMYNELSRRICRDTPDFDVIDNELHDIKKKSKYPFALTLSGNMLAAGGFAILFGGSLRDALAAALIGVIIAALANIRSRYLNDVTKTVFLSIVAGILTCLSIICKVGENMDMVAIGTIMLLIPGLWVGNAVRDLLYGDTLAGTVKIVQACVTAIMIAIGYAISIFLLGRYCPIYAGAVPFGKIGSIVAKNICAVIGTLGFAMMFKISPSRLWIVGLCGLSTYAVYEISVYFCANELLASFICSVSLALISELCARIFHAPTNVFLFPGCITIIPGGALYYTMYNLLTHELDVAMEYLSITFQTVFGIALGLIITSVILSAALEIIDRIKLKNHGA